MKTHGLFITLLAVLLMIGLLTAAAVASEPAAAAGSEEAQPGVGGVSEAWNRPRLEASYPLYEEVDADGAGRFWFGPAAIPAAPQIEIITPSTLEATLCPDSAITAALGICNDSGQSLTWEITPAGSIPWLSVEPISGTAAASECVTVEVTFDSTGMAPGAYTGTVQIDSDDVLSPVVTVTVTMIVASPPSGADFDWSPDVALLGQTVYVSGTVTGGSPPLAWSWDWGDGETTTGQYSNHTYAARDDYFATLTVTNTCGQAAVQHTVTVTGQAGIALAPPSLAATLCQGTAGAQDLSICNEGNIALTWEITHTGSIPWASEAPASGTLAPSGCITVGVTFDSTGLPPQTHTYTGTLQVLSNDDESPVVTVPLTMIVAGPPTGAGFTYTPAAPWIDQTVTFSGAATGPLPVDYAWSFGDGATGSGQNPAHAYAAGGAYTAIMTATQCGFPVTATHAVTVVPCWRPLVENFEGAFPPANWTVVDNGGTCSWQRNDAFVPARTNYAGGDGYCADADSDRCGLGSTMDTELRTMVLDLSAATTATLQYVTAYNDHGPGDDYADVDVSLDGGTTWSNLLHWDTDHSAYGPGEAVTLDLTPFQGESSVMVRFHYAGSYDWWWEVDQVQAVACIAPGMAPDIVVDPTDLTQTLGVNQTAVQRFTVANTGLGILNWTLDEGCGAPVDWLSASPASGTLNAYNDTDVVVTFDKTWLVAGTYTTTVCVNSNDPDEPSIPVDVTLIVTGTPDIALSPASLETTLCQGATGAQDLSICNEGDILLTWEITHTGSIPWASEAPVSGTVLAGECVSVAVTFDAGSLPAGVYTGGLLVESSDPDEPEITIPMTMTVRAAPSGADFDWSPDIVLLGQTVYVSGTVTGGSPPLAWSWDWGDGEATTGQYSNHTYAARDDYFATLTVTNTCGQAAVQHTVTVTGQAGIALAPPSLAATLCQGTAGALDLSICNEGNIALTWEVTHSGSIPWASEAPASGTLAPSGCITVGVTFDSTGLPPQTHTYTGTLQVLSNDDESPVVTVPLTMVVAGPPTGAGFTYTPAAPWIDQTVTFSGAATGPLPVDYAWSFGDGATGSGQNPAHAYTAGGAYTAIMTATQCGFPVTVTHTVTVAPCWRPLVENFEGAFPPANWTVVNNGGSCVWQRNDAFAPIRPNYAGAQGFCADADSDRCGSARAMDTELRTMVLDLSAATTATLQYVAAYYDHGAGDDHADVDASLDGGTTWSPLLNWDTSHSAYGPGEAVALDLTRFQGEPSVMIRFHYVGTYDWWWLVDRVRVNACTRLDAVPEITVAPTVLTQMLEVDQTAVQTFTIANVGLGILDWTLDEGCGAPVGWLSEDPTGGTLRVYHDTDVAVTFDSTGLALGAYTATVCVSSNDPDEAIIPVDVTLIVTGTPDIATAPGALEATVCQGETEVMTVTICNEGTGTLAWNIWEEGVRLAAIPATPANAPPVPASPAKERPVITSPEQCAQYENYTGLEPAGAAEFCTKGLLPLAASGAWLPALDGPAPLAPTDTGYAQDIGYLSENFVSFALNDFTGQTVVGTSTNTYYGLDFDPSATVLYALNDTTDQLGTIDLATGAFAAVAPCPPGGGADNWTGLTIDPIDGVFYGSTNTRLYTIDPTTGSSTLVGPFGATAMIAIAMNGRGQMYGHDIATDSIYRINPATGAATLIGPTGYPANYAQGMDFDGDDGTLYIFLYLGSGINVYGTVNLTTGAVTPLAVSAPVGQFEGATQTDALAHNIPWLTEAPAGGSVTPGECISVAVTFDADALPAGTYAGRLLIESSDRDEPAITIPVTMTVPEAPSGIGLDWSPEVPIVGQTAYFSGTVAGGSLPLTWSWDWGDGGTATGQYASHSYAAPGDYLVTLTVANACGQVVVEQTVAVIGEADVAVTPSSLETTLCQGETDLQYVSICNEGNIPLTWEAAESPPVSWLTEAPTSGIVPAGECISVAVAFDAGSLPAGGYAGSLLITSNDPDEPEITVQMAMTVREAPFGAGFGWLPSLPIVGETVHFSGTVAGGSLPLAWSWEWGDGETGTGQYASHAYAAPGDYLVTLTVTNGCGETVVEQTVMVLEERDIVITPSSLAITLCPELTRTLTFTICNEGDVLLDWSLSEAPAAAWLSEDPISGTMSGGECQVVEATFSSAGLTAGLYGTALVIASNDPDEPEIAVPIQMTVLEPASVEVTYSIDNLVVSFDATAAGAGPLTFSWDFNDGGTSTAEDPTHVYAHGGCYEVTLIVTNQCGQAFWQAQICVYRRYYLPIIWAGNMTKR